MRAHLEDAHGMFHDIDSLLALTFLEPHEKEVRFVTLEFLLFCISVQVIVEKVMPRILRLLEQAKLQEGRGRGAIERRLKEGEEEKKRSRKEDEVSPPKRMRMDSDEIAGRVLETIEDPIDIEEDSVEDEEVLKNTTLSEEVDKDQTAEEDKEMDDDYDTEKKIGEHPEKDTKDEEAECEICHFSFPQPSLILHIKQHHGWDNQKVGQILITFK